MFTDNFLGDLAISDNFKWVGVDNRYGDENIISMTPYRQRMRTTADNWWSCVGLVGDVFGYGL